MTLSPNTINDVLIIKVGTSTLVKKASDGSESLDIESFHRIGQQIAALQDEGRHVILVTSASITAGMLETDIALRPSRKENMIELQRLSAVGWRSILNAWSDSIGDRTVASLLITKHELDPASQERREVLATIHTMLTHGDLPVANENDPITHEEIEFGDNDTLAATLAARIGSSDLFSSNVKLVLLSDVDGVYKDINNSQSLINTVEDLTELDHLAGPPISMSGTGGMTTKFAAAKIATRAGVDMWLANGKESNAIQKTLRGEIGTHFPS